MRKLFFTLISALMTTALFAVNADLEIRKGVDLEPNGLEDDAVWSQIAPVYITKTFNTDPTPTVDGSYFKMFYTDQYIYLLVNVTDDVFYPLYMNPTDVKNEHIYDKVEVYFDVNDVLKDGNGPAYTSGYMAPGHYQMAPRFEEDYLGSLYYPDNVLYGSLSKEVAICYDVKSRLEYTGYIVEYKFPMDAFVNDRSEKMNLNAFKNLPNGLGFDVIIVDNDKPKDDYGRKRAVWKNAGPSEPYTNMDDCAVVKLIDGGTSVKKVEISKTKVYPNLVSDVLTVEGDINKVVISSVSGQQIKVIENQNTINVTDLEKGLYLVGLYQDNVLKGTHKIIKK